MNIFINNMKYFLSVNKNIFELMVKKVAVFLIK